LLIFLLAHHEDTLTAMTLQTTTDTGDFNFRDRTMWITFRSASKSNAGNVCVQVGQAADARKASKSGAAGHCVTVTAAAAARKASKSAQGRTCVTVEPARDGHDASCTAQTCKTPGVAVGDIVVRDSKLGDDSPWVVFQPAEWADFVAAVIAGAHEVVDGDYLIRDGRTGVTLHYTPAEWDAFLDGCVKDEFAYDLIAA
jgi:uncharacterized protein DUF397